MLFEATLSDEDIDQCRVDVLRKLADQVAVHAPLVTDFMEIGQI